MNLQTISSPLKKRIAIVDGLRGTALLGIVLAHALGWFIAGFIPEKVWQVYQHDVASTVVSYIDGIFISGKFYTFFSFLFGVSFALQFTQRKPDDTHFNRRFLWRLVLLFIIGFIHHIHWRGDILGIYAIAGVFLLLFNYFNSNTITVLAILLCLNTPILLKNTYKLYYPDKPKTEKIQKQENEKANIENNKNYQTLKTGTYTAILHQNFQDFAFKADFQWNSGRFFVTIGFFLLGLLAGRKKVFEHLDTLKPVFRKTLWLTLVLNVVIVALFLTIQFTIPYEKLPTWFNAFAELLFSVHSCTMTLFYITGFSLLLSKTSWQGVLTNLSYIGKMALTNYLLQSTIGILLFYGYGFGLAGNFSPAWCFVLGIMIFIGQIFFSKWWLSQYYYGPIEWLWRSATYWQWQKMKR
jgi:uncharacterized protein